MSKESTETQFITFEEAKAALDRMDRDVMTVQDKRRISMIVFTFFLLQQMLSKPVATLKKVRDFVLGKNFKLIPDKRVPIQDTTKTQEPEQPTELSTDPSTDSSTKPGLLPLTEVPPKSPKSPGDLSPDQPKTPGHGRLHESSYTGAEDRLCPHGHYHAGDICPKCESGTLYPGPPKQQILLHGNAPVTATRFEVETLHCSSCKAVFNAREPQGKYDVSVMTSIAMSRYFLGIPFSRLEYFQQQVGVPLPDATQWDLMERLFFIIFPVLLVLIRMAAQAILIHQDDTQGRILQLTQENHLLPEGERKGVHSTALVADVQDQTVKRRIILYFTGRAHAGENLDLLLQLRNPGQAPLVQMSDALSANTAQNYTDLILRCFCNAHAFRKFKDITDNFPEPCEVILKAIGSVFRNDQTTRKEGMDDQQRLRYHQEHSAPLLAELKTWMEQQLSQNDTEENSPLGRSIKYMLKRWDGFTLFLRHPGVPLDNNVVERALKRLIFQRKNSFFYATARSAYMGNAITSLIVTAVEANSNIYDYFNQLQIYHYQVSRYPERWLPWNYQQAVEKCKATMTKPPDLPPSQSRIPLRI